MSELPITADEPITAEDVDFENELRFETDLESVEWALVPYDYNEETGDMALYELVVEGRTVITFDQGYGDTWALTEKEDGWYYQAIIDDNVFSEDRYNLEKIVRERVGYYVREYEKYSRLADEYNGRSAWELRDIRQNISSLEGDLQDVGHDIQGWVYEPGQLPHPTSLTA